MAFEIIDNAVDEAQAGFATRMRADAERRRQRDGARRWPRHPDRPARRGGRLRRRGRADPAARRRQVQPEHLQGVRRPARRRRRRGQRALRVDGGAHLAQRPRALHPLRARRRRAAAEGGRPVRQAQRHRGHVQAEHRHLHQDRVRLRRARAPAARAGLPQLRPVASCCATSATRRRRRPRSATRAGWSRSCSGWTAARRRSSPSRSSVHHRGEPGRHPRRVRAVLERQLPRDDALLHQQHPAAGRRHASGRVPPGADPRGDEIRRGHGQEGEPRTGRRGHARGHDRGAVGQGARPEIPQPDQGQAGQLRGAAGGAGRGRGHDRPLVRDAPEGGQGASSRR